MNILICMKLGDTKVDSKLRSIAQIEDVERILVVRDYPGPELSKVEYYSPLGIISKVPILSGLYKLGLLFYLSLSNKLYYIHSYLFFPHGILAFITAKLTRRPIGISLIAGPVELYTMGKSPLGVKFTRPVPWFGRMLLTILRQCDIVTTTGPFTRDFLINHGVDENKIHILHHASYREKYRPMNVQKKFDVISVGRLHPVKHLEVLLKAVAIVKKKFQEVKLAVIGDGPSKHYLEDLSQALGIEGNVDFLGYKENVTFYYNSSKVFVLTSEREGFPTSFVEAMMCGLPSVVSNCGDIMEIAKDGYNAVVIRKYDDIQSYADAIIHLIENSELRAKLTHNALETVKDVSVERVSQDWRKILKSISRHRKS